MRKIFLFYCLLAVSVLISCAEEEDKPLPYVHVNLSVPLYMYPNLQAGLPVKLRENCGYNNNKIIIVPRGDTYEAFDATCTRNITEETTSIGEPKADFTATCPKCGTVYNLFTGYAQNQSFHLQRYRAYMSNDRIYVTN